MVRDVGIPLTCDSTIHPHTFAHSQPYPHDELCQSLYQPKICDPFQHIMISPIDHTKSTILFENDVQEGLTDKHEEENNFISVIRRSLKQVTRVSSTR